MNDLDRLLTQRTIAAPSDGFEQRIIAAAYARPQVSHTHIMAWLYKSWNELMLPSPQLAFTLMLAVGLAIGFNSQPATHGASAVEAYLSDDGAIL